MDIQESLLKLNATNQCGNSACVSLIANVKRSRGAQQQ